VRNKWHKGESETGHVREDTDETSVGHNNQAEIHHQVWLGFGFMIKNMFSLIWN
jgi:hypothetical protein